MGNTGLNIKFPKFPLIFLWIEKEYEECGTVEEIKNYMWECFDIAHATKNPVKSQAYYKTACIIYSKLTGKSWESMNQLIEKWANRKTT